jgi:hypothetical protein
VVHLGGGRKQRWCSMILRRYGGERDEMEGEKISLSSHLRGRYQIFSPVVNTHYVDTVRPRSVRRVHSEIQVGLQSRNYLSGTMNLDLHQRRYTSVNTPTQSHPLTRLRLLLN